MDFFDLRFYIDFFISYDVEPFKKLWMSFVIAGCIYLVFFVLEGIALWTIAGREGYRHRWMAFVPVLNSYYIGVVSDKNKFYNRIPARSVSLALAIVELLLVAGYVLYYVVTGIVLAGGLYDTQAQQMTIMGQTQTFYVITGSSSAISGMWLGWIFDYLDTAVLSWVKLIYILLHVVTIITFFQTYACRRYVMMSLFSVFLPVKPILMFAVRGNRGMNYHDFVRGEQRRRYEMYQQYNYHSGDGRGGYNPYNGRPTPPPSDDPYSGTGGGSSSGDPFEGFGSSSGGSSQDPGDPFDDLKK